MARIHGRNAVIKVGAASPPTTNISGASNEVSIDVAQETAESLGYGVDWKENLEGHASFKVSGKVMLESGTPYNDDTLYALMGGALVYFDIQPAGAGTGKPAYTGTFIPTSYKISPPLKGVVAMEFSGEGTGTLTRAAQT